MSSGRNGPVVEHVDGDVKVSVHGRVAQVTIDRPSKKNASDASDVPEDGGRAARG